MCKIEILQVYFSCLFPCIIDWPDKITSHGEVSLKREIISFHQVVTNGRFQISG